ncbi:hypothetical protein GC105_00895 [Alkalibaculum sp. M08DMB]|uniref:ABC-2 transporter permease n=1 Tax=Alkalibaculum sporogenes TaxID=2655001 RepID=A0A6A7K4H0_9FIRM|nr:ABC-2 transporter permease [Alkalibaculum sporogenes]MPW24349.1 hypothetical protein [Alkalibaculum sporogenes]
MSTLLLREIRITKYNILMFLFLLLMPLNNEPLTYVLCFFMVVNAINISFYSDKKNRLHIFYEVLPIKQRFYVYLKFVFTFLLLFIGNIIIFSSNLLFTQKMNFKMIAFEWTIILISIYLPACFILSTRQRDYIVIAMIIMVGFGYKMISTNFILLLVNKVLLIPGYLLTLLTVFIVIVSYIISIKLHRIWNYKIMINSAK